MKVHWRLVSRWSGSPVNRVAQEMMEEEVEARGGSSLHTCGIWQRRAKLGEQSVEQQCSGRPMET